MSKVEVVQLRHIARVRQLLGQFASEMIARGDRHDASKFSPVELEPLTEMQNLIDKEGNAKFGTTEYEKRIEILKPMLAHHFTHNSHHPEHYSNGVNGMDLFDLVEMFFDWKAASERNGETSMNVCTACSKFKMDPMLVNILENTAKNLGYE